MTITHVQHYIIKMNSIPAVIGDLHKQKCLKSLLRLQWIEIESFSLEEDFSINQRESDSDSRTRDQIAHIWYEFEHLNASIHRQLLFSFDKYSRRRTKHIYTVRYYYRAFVSVYGDDDITNEVREVFEQMADLYRRILVLNSTLQYPVYFSYVQAEENERVFLSNGVLVQPADGYYTQYCETKKQGECFVQWLYRFANDLTD